MCNVYIIECQSIKPYPIKIGVSNDVQERRRLLQTANPYKLIIKDDMRLKTRAIAYDLEAFLHREFNKSNIRNEWFNPSDININKAVMKWNSISSEDSKVIVSTLTDENAAKLVEHHTLGMSKAEVIAYAKDAKEWYEENYGEFSSAMAEQVAAMIED
jgi:hypothetical protein